MPPIRRDARHFRLSRQVDPCKSVGTFQASSFHSSAVALLTPSHSINACPPRFARRSGIFAQAPSPIPCATITPSPLCNSTVARSWPQQARMASRYVPLPYFFQRPSTSILPLRANLLTMDSYLSCLPSPPLHDCLQYADLQPHHSPTRITHTQRSHLARGKVEIHGPVRRFGRQG